MAASAYYGNASDELRLLAREFFNSMDTNGDGVVSFNEFVEFLVENGYNGIDDNIFRSLDRNGDGILDFKEFLTFYYVWKTRVVRCAYCGICLMGPYFTCVACFDNARTYDLCSTCYNAQMQRQQHPHHNYFLDSGVMLRDKTSLPFHAPTGVWCNYCRINCLMGLYFTCVACFDDARANTYDLCSKCYNEQKQRQQHPHHNYFLDSYVLLRTKTGLPLPAGAPNLQRALVQHAPNISQQALVQYAPNTPQQRRLTAFQHWRWPLMLGIWLLAVASCDRWFIWKFEDKDQYWHARHRNRHG